MKFQARIRLKSGRVIQLVLSTETEVDAVVHSIQLLSMIGTGSKYGKSQKLSIVKRGAFSLYCPMNSDDMTINKTHPTLDSNL